MSIVFTHRAVEVGGIEPPRHRLTILAPHPLPPQQQYYIIKFAGL